MRELEPDDPRWPHLLGVLRRDEGRHEEAEAELRAALSMRGAAPAVRLHLARLLFDQNRLDEAVETLQPALAAAAVDPAAIATQGEIELARGNAGEAARLLDLALGLVPAANRLHYPLANAKRALGDDEGFQRHLAAAGEVGLRPADPLLDRLESLQVGHTAHMHRAERAYARGRFEDAAAEYQKALAASPEDVASRIGLAAALASAGREAEAVTPLRDALRLEPGNANAHFGLGSLLLARGEAEQAAAHFRSVLALRPADGAAQLGLARALASQGLHDEAISELRGLLARDPSDDEAWLVLAQWLANRSDWQGMVQTLEDARKALPGHPRVASTLARALAAVPDPGLRDGRRAHQLALEGFAADERWSHAETVALALAELDRCAEATVWLREALSRLDGSEPPGARKRLEEAIARYRAGPPCRAAVAENLSP
jgi:tetratricopeptide (TPR) repeat protein